MSSPFSKKRLAEGILGAFKKLHPRTQLRNPVMFVVYVGAILTTLLWAHGFVAASTEPQWFVAAVAAWLWFTVLISTFAESLAEGAGRAQASSLRALRKEVRAKKLRSATNHKDFQVISASSLHRDDVVLVEAGDFIPCDGQVIAGIASVDESAITGESAPVIRESGGDSDAVTGGTRVLSDWIVVRISANPGETFLDKMVGLVEGAKRGKTPNEIALSILLAALTLIFLLAIATLLPFTLYAVHYAGGESVVGPTELIALLVCLAPTTIGGLLSAIGISGMSRLLSANVIAMSGRAVEAAGDVNVLLLDKTGTITHGNRQADSFYPADGITANQLMEASLLSSMADQTPEGKSILSLARKLLGGAAPAAMPVGAEMIEFSAETRVSGVKLPGRDIIKGAPDALEKYLTARGGSVPASVRTYVEEVARKGGTPLVVAEGARALGVIYLKDVVKAGIRERLADLRKMGIKSVMITGDNPLTAAAIAAEAGVDDYLAQATPETKLKYIRGMQAGGELVAMVGDGTNDAPALAQSDVAVCMNSGTQAAKEAANMIDLDSDPTKLIEIVEIGKQLLITRGALTTFSVANDVAKYFAVVPAAFASTYPALSALNIMQLASPLSAIISAVIFNALVIFALIPLALKGVKYRPMPAAHMLRRNLTLYGLGGMLVPFAAIKLIDLLLAALGWV